MKAKQNILFGILLFCILMLIYSLWRPWGPIVVWGLCGVLHLRVAIVLWRRAKMLYVAIGYGIWTIVSLVFFLQLLVIPNASWGVFVVFPAPFVLLIMMHFERRKNPDKVKKYESAWKRVSFFELLSLKYIADLEDKEKPENEE